MPYTLDPGPWTLHPVVHTLNPAPRMPKPEPYAPRLSELCVGLCSEARVCLEGRTDGGEILGVWSRGLRIEGLGFRVLGIRD